jgi:hypothetical protein
MDPLAGSFIYMRMLGAMMTIASEQKLVEEPESKKELSPEERARMLCVLTFMKGAMSFEDTKFIQTQALATVSKEILADKESGSYVPIFTLEGVWVAKELISQPSTVQKLIQEALVFNLAPFLADSGTLQI